MNNYDILLFDADNTLFDFSAAERECFFDLAPAFNIPAKQSVYEAYRKFNLESWKDIEKGILDKEFLLLRRYKRLFEFLNIHGDEKALNQAFLEKLAEKSILFPYAQTLLNNLLAAKKRIFLITNGVASVQYGRLNSSPVKNVFEKVFISEEIGASKPDKKFFDYVEANISHFDKEKTIVIGDSLSSDIAGANNAELDCIWYDPEFSQALPDGVCVNYIARTLQEIERFLLQ